MAEFYCGSSVSGISAASAVLSLKHDDRELFKRGRWRDVTKVCNQTNCRGFNYQLILVLFSASRLGLWTVQEKKSTFHVFNDWKRRKYNLNRCSVVDPDVMDIKSWIVSVTSSRHWRALLSTMLFGTFLEQPRVFYINCGAISYACLNNRWLCRSLIYCLFLRFACSSSGQNGSPGIK